MNLHLVWEMYYDYASNHSRLLGIFNDETLADLKVLELEESNTDKQISYFTNSMKMNELTA